jgi:endonuclease/exonuclease/phosphatase (EEP) superfamily protein YafD
MPDILRYSLITATLFLAALTAGAFYGHAQQPFEILSHFRAQFAAAAILVLIVALIGRSRWTALVACATALVNIAVLAIDLTYVAPEQPAAAGVPVRTVIFANLEGRPDALTAIAALAQAQQADIVALTELTINGAADVRAKFPDFACFTQPLGPLTPLTTMIAARAPCPAAGDSLYENPSDVVYADIDGLRVVALHPRPPWGTKRTVQRDEAIKAGLALKSQTLPTLLIGDLNTTAYSEAMNPLGAAGFRRAACGAPFATTWRDPLFLLGLAIDHAFVSDRLRLVSCDIGPWNTSDHAPLVVRVQLP